MSEVNEDKRLAEDLYEEVKEETWARRPGHGEKAKSNDIVNHTIRSMIEKFGYNQEISTATGETITMKCMLFGVHNGEVVCLAQKGDKVDDRK